MSLLTPQGTLSPMGMIPRTRRLRVAGIFSLGLFEFDSTYGFVSLDTARRLLDKDTVDYIQLRVDDIYAAPAIARSITATLGSQYLANDWAEMNRSLFSARCGWRRWPSRSRSASSSWWPRSTSSPR